jgi:3-deoxy-D-manno-octulosonate 8-phosphate phosphatase KdsC-like HAD superfamily phosphatase
MLWMYIERATEPVLSIRLMLVLLGSVDGCLTRRSMHIDNNAACLKVFFFSSA